MTLDSVPRTMMVMMIITFIFTFFKLSFSISAHQRPPNNHSHDLDEEEGREEGREQFVSREQLPEALASTLDHIVGQVLFTDPFPLLSSSYLAHLPTSLFSLSPLFSRLLTIS